MVVAAALFAGCGGGGDTSTLQPAQVESCMQCHNGTVLSDYSGPGLENPHPFDGAANIRCTTCHGGNPDGTDMASSHVPPPPQIGDRTFRAGNGSAAATANFNKQTLAGLDLIPDYTVDGRTYTASDYLQFVQPGDLRIVNEGRGCGQCHANHGASVATMTWSTGTGIYSGWRYYFGVNNAQTQNQGLYDDTAADYAARAITDPNYVYDPANNVGAVQSLMPMPVKTVFGQTGGTNVFRNPAYDAAQLQDDVNADNSIVTGSSLETIFMSQLDNGCGNCHLNQAGANNRYGDFRSSGCTACHMQYSKDGKSQSADPNIVKTEPANPDAIAAGERPHVRMHRIASTKKTVASGQPVEGITDYACAGCHQNANRDVLTYWGIRMDQNQDVVNGRQYPANPVSFTTTHNDTRLYDPVVGNNTFNGRNPNQHLGFEDYDGDGRDDTPPDVHYDAGMGCIDCHNSVDLHGGDVNNPNDTKISSHFEEEVAIKCESCHGTATAYATTQQDVAWDGTVQQVVVGPKGNLLRHVVRENDGNYYLYSKLTGAKHWVSQTKDVIVNSGKSNPFTSQPVFNPKASFAMGRDDGDPSNGSGPHQAGQPATGFSHTDNMDCASCHSSWGNTCVGCHLKGRYNEGNNFSNFTGQRTVYQQTNADFVYDTPVPFQLGVGADNKISQFWANTKVYFQYRDRNGVNTPIFSTSDRNGDGNNPANGIGALGHNKLYQHSIRGKVSANKEGPRYCVACHLTTNSISNFGTEYAAFRAAIQARNYGALDYNLLKNHIGKNTGNQLDSPLWVHMVAGLGSGLFLFNDEGGALNPLDTFDNRIGSNGTSPADAFNPANVVTDLDRIVDETGFSFAENTHSMLHPGVGPNLRDGAADPTRPGPLGATILRKLTDPVNGVVLESWIDANGVSHGSQAP
jgi:hypothetical protein